jgi:diphosphomevalonate decarboxylase
MSFNDTFEVLIISTDVQRLHYFLSSFKGEVKSLIQNLAITNNNFPVAWQLVTQRYINVKLIAMTHVKELYQIPQARQNDAASLRQLTNHVANNFTALRALTLDIPLRDLILIHLILCILDPETHKAWELRTVNQQLSSMADFITFLEGRCNALELMQDLQTTTVRCTPSTRHPQTATEKVSRDRSNCNLTT